MKKLPWWSEEYGFFGEHYLEGDDSKDGYLIEKKQTLEERTKTEVEGIINILGLKNKEEILDVPSGYGRHSIGLAQKGFNVTGVELNSVHLAEAIKNSELLEQKPDFIKENMINIDYKEKFDAIINMFYSFGFFETDKENNEVLKRFYEALKPNGKFLMHTDVNIPRVLSGKYKEDEIRELKSGNTLRVIDKYNKEDKRIYGSWIIKDKDENEIKRDYSVRVYTKEEFIDICKMIGFQKFEVYGDWDKNPYSENSEDMIIVAEK